MCLALLIDTDWQLTQFAPQRLSCSPGEGLALRREDSIDQAGEHEEISEGALMSNVLWQKKYLRKQPHRLRCVDRDMFRTETTSWCPHSFLCLRSSSYLE